MNAAVLGIVAVIWSVLTGDITVSRPHLVTPIEWASGGTLAVKEETEIILPPSRGLSPTGGFYIETWKEIPIITSSPGDSISGIEKVTLLPGMLVFLFTNGNGTFYLSGERITH